MWNKEYVRGYGNVRNYYFFIFWILEGYLNFLYRVKVVNIILFKFYIFLYCLKLYLWFLYFRIKRIIKLSILLENSI